MIPIHFCRDMSNTLCTQRKYATLTIFEGELAAAVRSVTPDMLAIMRESLIFFGFVQGHQWCIYQSVLNTKKICTINPFTLYNHVIKKLHLL